jgi:hypothetical protein
MLFAVGTRVRLRHSREKGVVTTLLDHNMVKVLLDGMDMEIPVAADDLVREEEDDAFPSRIKAKNVPGKKDKTVYPPEQPGIETQYTILKSHGIQLAFDPIRRGGVSPEQFAIYLLNDTPHDVLFTYRLQLRETAGHRQNGRLPALSFQKLGTFLFDKLNDAPTVDIECWRITTEGTGSRLHRKLRIRPKHFFGRVKTAPLLNRKVHLFKVFEDITKSTLKRKTKEDLRTYTHRNTRPASKWRQIEQRFPYDIQALAEFIPEIDLHIEKLTNNYAKMSKAEILRLQLRHFEDYLQRAITLGVERVFIIHGIGKGSLRNAIADRLKDIPEVSDFKNEYHPKYGWGATEVIFV